MKIIKDIQMILIFLMNYLIQAKQEKFNLNILSKQKNLKIYLKKRIELGEILIEILIFII